MNVFEGLEAITLPLKNSTVAIGAFDGIHVGHQAIIRAAVEDANRNNRQSVVFTFDRRPATVIDPDRAAPYLTTPKQRIRLIQDLNPDNLVIARFDRSIFELSPDDFISQILKDKFNASAVVVGNGFFFGKNRSGDVDFLRQVQSRYAFSLNALEPVSVDGEMASSTRIRELLKQGDVKQAERFLGHSYLLAGTVVRGQQLGRTLGYPTANLDLTVRQLVPLDGIWAVKVTLDDGRSLCGACSIGNRPTVEGAGRSIETFLFDFDEDIYGREMEIQFIQYLRPELKFVSLDALIVQMREDVIVARQILKV